MLDSITIKINNPSNLLDIGYLAECLLFYDKTNILIDKDSLTELFRFCGIEEIYELIQRGNLSILTKGNILGAGKKEDLYFVDLFSAQNVDKHYQTIYEALFSIYEKQGKARRNAQRFDKITSSFKYDTRVLDDIRSSINDNFFVKQIINGFIKELGAEKEFLGKEWYYDYIPVDEYSYRHVTNIDLDKLNALALEKKLHFDFSPSSLILNMSESFGDIQVALSNNSEIFTTPIDSQIINLKFDSIFEKARVNKDTITQFQKLALPNYKDLASVINNGGKSFKDLINLIDKAEKFKKWKGELDSETNFIEEYSKALSKESWLDRMPSKVGRFVIFESVGVLLDIMGTGGIGTVAASTLNAADSFLLDKILRKWKPNQFIKEDLKNFVK